jgi:threonine dehydrogenase-like Zn-dependent dehydrogenase
MGNNVMITAERTIGFEAYAEASLAPNEVRIQTLYSGISSGTELTAYRGSNPYLHKRWDAKRKLFVPDETPSASYPMGAWGYEECGRITEVGSAVSLVKVGDLVSGSWGHRTSHVMSENSASLQLMPPGLDPILGIFGRMGAIALNGVHDAAIRIGETVAVFGLGTPGQMVAQLAKKSGATVIGVEFNRMRLDKAVQLGGVDIPLDANEGQVAERIKAFTENRGADVCIEATGFYSALHEAIRSAAYSAKVVAMGFFQGQGQGLFLGEEFHHNRINLVCSQIFGVNPELRYRWDDTRQAQTFLRLMAEGIVNMRPIISHILPFNQAGEAFRLCDQEGPKTIQVALEF